MRTSDERPIGKQEMAKWALKLQPKHPLATYVMARLISREGKTDEAIALAEPSLDLEQPDLMLLNLLAGLKLKAGKLSQAESLYQLGDQRDPYNLQWTRSLVRLYVAAKEQAKLADALARIAKADPDDLAVRKKLAELAMAKKDLPGATDWVNQALEIDVTDAEILSLLERLKSRE